MLNSLSYFGRPVGRKVGYSLALRSCRAHLSRQRPSPFDEVGQRQHDEGTIDILAPAAIAHLGKAPQALEDQERVLDLRADARLAAISVTDIPVVGDHFLDGQENFLAVFICGCTSDCSHPDNWECNTRTGGGMGPHNGRWIIMPFNRCVEGEKRLVPDPNPPGDYTQAYECKNGQWQQYVCNGSPC